MSCSREPGSKETGDTIEARAPHSSVQGFSRAHLKVCSFDVGQAIRMPWGVPKARIGFKPPEADHGSGKQPLAVEKWWEMAKRRKAVTFLVILSAFFNLAVMCVPACRAGLWDGITQPQREGRYDFIDWSKVTGAIKIPVYFCTNRKLDGTSFSDTAGSLTYGWSTVVVPDRHAKLNKLPVASWSAESKGSKNRDYFVTHNAALSYSQLASGSDLAKTIRGSGAQPLDTIVFIHGFNNSLDDALKGAAELCYWYEKPVVVFSWPAAKAAAAAELGKVYEASDSSVDTNMPAFAEFMTELSGSNGVRSDGTILIAHSMGNHLLFGYLKQLCGSPSRSVFKEAVFCSADIDGQTFADNVNCMTQCAEKIRVYYNSNDDALKQAAAKHLGHPRLGGEGSHIDAIVRNPKVQVISLSSMLLGYFDHDIPDSLLASMSRYGNLSLDKNWQLTKNENGTWQVAAKRGYPLRTVSDILERLQRRVAE